MGLRSVFMNLRKREYNTIQEFNSDKVLRCTSYARSVHKFGGEGGQVVLYISYKVSLSRRPTIAETMSTTWITVMLVKSFVSRSSTPCRYLASHPIPKAVKVLSSRMPIRRKTVSQAAGSSWGSTNVIKRVMGSSDLEWAAEGMGGGGVFSPGPFLICARLVLAQVRIGVGGEIGNRTAGTPAEFDGPGVAFLVWRRPRRVWVPVFASLCLWERFSGLSSSVRVWHVASSP